MTCISVLVTLHTLLPNMILVTALFQFITAHFLLGPTMFMYYVNNFAPQDLEESSVNSEVSHTISGQQSCVQSYCSMNSTH